MTFIYNPIIIPLIFSAIVLIGLFGITYKFRKEKSTRVFLGLLICLLIWTVGFILEIMGVSLSTKLFWANIQFLGILFIPILLLLLTITITGRGTRYIPFLKLMTILVIASIGVIWTNDLHHLFRVNPSIDIETASFPILVNDYGFWFNFIQSPTAYITYLLNFSLLIQAIRISEKTYRMQATFILACLVLPLLTDLIYVLGYSPIPNFNLTIIMFSLSGLIVGWALFRYKMFDLGPMAYQLVIQNMQDGVVVINKNERMVSLNSAAYEIIGTTEAEALGEPIDKIIPFWDTLNHNERNIYTHPLEINNENEQHYEILISPIFSKPEKIIGQVITLRNVTQRVKLQQETQVLASTDSLTNVLNRRAFFNSMGEALQASMKSKTSLTFIMFDIDNFKEINDQHGHHFGDKTLVKVAETCMEHLRKREILGRYGGDEFCVLLPETNIEQTKTIANRLFQAISTLNFSSNEKNVILNVSMGIAVYYGKEKVDIGDILNTADKALYKAKEAGKNQYVIMGMGEG